MIFSYGFIEDGMKDARDILLSLDIPDDDPLKRAKQAVSSSAPGVRLIDSVTKGLQWQSDFIWLVCVNEEDGLHFEIAQTADGDQELTVAFQGQPLEDTANLQGILESSPMWEVYHLRAVSIIQDRLEEQLNTLLENAPPEIDENAVENSPRGQALKLRRLEAEMLERFYDFLEHEVCFSR